MEQSSQTKAVDPLTRALGTIKKLKAQLDAQGAHQPLAIVGVGLRLPGGISSLDSYWRALVNGDDLVRTMSAERRARFAARWEGLPHKGGYLDQVLAFDAEFFGVSPREARALDPQHRLLLEVAWEALENAALAPEQLKSLRTGMYLGVTGQDYRDWQPAEPDAYWATGNGHCFAAGRIAYALGLTGPTLSVDTACSSSLVAVHLASQALRAGECDVALAGGVNLVLSPRSTELVVQTRSLSPDGLCKTFDARANGFTRGEGCGVVVLKRLDRALLDGDRIHAVVRGSAVNQDGRSSGFTAPNVLAQVALIEAALADADLTARDIGLVEAHGTGTSLGDPIEMEALVTALARKSQGTLLHVGSVKTNIGHLEAAAGIAGLLKAIACLKYRQVPPLVHFRTLNPRIDLSDAQVQISAQLSAWDTQRSGANAAVSSFGMSGTNAQIILGAVDPSALAPAQSAEVEGFVVSAKSEPALRALCARYAECLAGLSAENYPAFAYTATTRGASHAVAARVSASTRDTAVEALQALAQGALLAGVDSSAELRELPRQVVDLPSYPWQRAVHAPECTASMVDAATKPASVDEAPLYELAWGSSRDAGGSTPRQLLLAGDDRARLESLRSAAERAGVGVRVLERLPSDAAGWDSLWSELGESRLPVEVLLSLRATRLPERLAGDTQLVQRGATLCAAVASAAVEVARARKSGLTVRLRSATHATRAVLPEDVLSASDHGLLHGLSPVLSLELGESWAGTVDLPLDAQPRDFDALIALACSASREDVVAVRAGALHVGRLRRLPAHKVEPTQLRPDASYLLTGGLGAVGRVLLKDFVARGARSLVVVGRTEESALEQAAESALRDARAAGANVVYRSADCGDACALERAFEVFSGLPALRGVVHGAGALAPCRLANASASSFEPALSGKFAGAWWLHLLTRELSLDFFLGMSSVSAVWGTEGYGPYAAANAGLDAVAGHRRTLGLPATSIAFGPWDVAGMADEAGRSELARMGVSSLSEQLGCASLAAGCDAGAHLIACPVEWPRFLPVIQARGVRPLFVDLSNENQVATTSAALSSSTLLAELSALALRPKKDRVRRETKLIVASVLGYEKLSELREEAGFFDLGMDSIMAVDLTKALSGMFGVDLAVSDIFDHPTVAALSERLLGLLPQQAEPAPKRVAVSPLEEEGDLASEREEDDAHGHSCELVTALPYPSAASGAASVQVATKQDDAIAIVGLAGRFPGADTLEELWAVLRDGKDTVSQVPSSRWDSERTREGGGLGVAVTSDQGGFLRDIARFDAAFFGIPAREADSLDPQHRLLLEVAWHALEAGAIDPKSIKGSRTGVFIGISNSDYARVLEQGGLSSLDAYFGTGTALNAAAGRIAYLLGLNGPALAVDTACSSSLVALHLAVQSLRRGETDCMLAGGVNVITAPSCSVAVSRAHMLSPEGRCKSFSADADGFVRAEGCGVVVLKRLGDAVRDGNRVLALIHGSAVNQDGASSGLTVPSGKAQEAVIRAALADAKLSADAVSYLEAHGTGTSLGDPIEVHAAWAALCAGRRASEPLLLGSIKSNIGHSESASGMASLIKTVLALRNRQLPKSLHAESLNPNIKWQDMNVRVVDTLTEWPNGKPRIAGISGFGFSGTNAHVLVGESPVMTRSVSPSDGPVLLPLSAPDAESLARVSAEWTTYLEDAPAATLPNVAYSAAVGRAHFPVRRALLARNKEDLLAQLKRPSKQPEQTHPPRVAFLFSGQGSQYFGMGRDLYETEPVFRDVIDRADRILSSRLGASLRQLMFYGKDPQLINQTRITQPALVAIELALAALWESWGVSASAVIGHSVGEIAACIYAGVLEFEAGLLLIAERARLMQGTAAGAMLAVSAPLARVSAALVGTTLDIAAINGPDSVVVAGTPAEIELLAAKLKAQDIIARPLVVSHAFHSRLMEPILKDLHAAIAPFSFRAPELPLISNLTGKVARASEYDAAYFCRHVREPVRFLDGARSLFEQEIDVCLEIGPDRTLINLASAAGLLAVADGAPSLRRGSKDAANMLAALKCLYEHGQALDWKVVHQHSGAARTRVPLYPFAGAAHWAKLQPGAQPSASSQPALKRRHWGTELRSPQLSGRAFAFERTADFPAYLTDHRLYGTVVTPAASHLGTILSALGGDGRSVVIEDMICPRALVIKEGERYDAQILLSAATGASQLSVQSLLDPEQGVWQEHLGGRIVEPGSGRVALRAPETAGFIASAERHIDGKTFYRYFRELGYTLGPSFCWIADVWIRGDEAVVRYAAPQLPDAVSDYQIYPGLIDSCFQSIAGFMVDEIADEAASLAIPFAAARLSFVGRPVGAELWGHVHVKRADALPNGRMRVELADLHMFTADGVSLFEAEDFRVRHASRAVLEQSLRSHVPHAYHVRWSPLAASLSEQAPRHIALLHHDQTKAAELAAALAATGHVVKSVANVSELDAQTDLIIDGRLRALAELRSADEAVDVASALAGVLAEAPRTLPYVSLSSTAARSAPARQMIWGLLNALDAEQTDRTILRVAAHDDVDAGALSRAILDALAARETRLSVDEHGASTVARLAHFEQPLEAKSSAGSVLITGGLGALGLSVARMRAQQGAKAIVLMGRSSPDQTARTVISELQAAGIEVCVVLGDVTRLDDCKRAIAEAKRHAPLGSVFHLAGANEDKAFDRLTRADFEQTFRAKVQGALSLVQALRGEVLDALVLFSSVASALGSPGQVNYAAANGVLDGLAELLRAEGVCATAVNWGPWVPSDKGGMAATAAVSRASERIGLRPLTDGEAGPLLALAASTSASCLVAVAADFGRYASHLAGHPRSAFVTLLAEQSEVYAETSAAPVRSKAWLADFLKEQPADEREDALRQAVRTLVCEVLGNPELGDDRLGFAELGLDSIMAIDVRTKLSHAVGLDLPATLAIDHPSVVALSSFVHDKIFGVRKAVVKAAKKSTVTDQSASLDGLSLEQLMQAVQLDLAAGE